MVNLQRAFVVFLLLVFTKSNNTFAQNQASVWYFGDQAVLNFTTTSVNVSLHNHYLNNGIAQATDCNRNMLFSGIDNIHNYSNSQSPQQQFIVPSITNTNQFYFFHSSDTPAVRKLKISLVDISLPPTNNVLSTDSLPFIASGKLAGVKHFNKHDCWVIAHANGTNQFYAYLITAAGLQPPIISSIGLTYNGNWNDNLGFLKISPDGKKIAVSNTGIGIIELFDFDDATGIISHPIVIQSSQLQDVFGIEFSPTGKYLYAATKLQPKLFQMDVSNHTATTVLNSMQLIDQLNSGYFGALQNGLDGKIYCSVAVSQYIASINHPNESALNCEYNRNSVALNGGTCLEGLPNFISTYFYLKCEP